MNERIKEIAQQCGFGEQWFEEHPTGCSLPKPLMLREFSEMIVRECMDKCFTEDGERIRKHFGVEE